MLDVHILVLPGRDPSVVARCIESARDATVHAGFRVDIHLIDGIIGHIGQGRASGYAKGEHPYVTCIDDDDFVTQNAFAQMGETLRRHQHQAIATPEWIERNGYRSEGKDRHHLIAYRRSVLIDHAAWKCCGDVMQIQTIPESHWCDLPDRAYVHNVYVSPARLLRRENQDELRMAIHG